MLTSLASALPHFRNTNSGQFFLMAGPCVIVGDETALRILQKVGREIGVPTVTDIHESEEAAFAAEYVDVLQIPAFLCRQTDLLIAAAKTGKVVNIKKGQFLSGEAMQFAVDKVRQSGNEHVVLTDRG